VSAVDAIGTLRGLLEPVGKTGPVDELHALSQQVAKRRTPDTVPVKLDGLQVDPDYQRPPDREKIASMVRRLKSGDRLDPIKANVRPDGSKWITDGQHRAAAAAICGHDTIDTVLTFKPSQDEPAETNLLAKVSEDADSDAIGLLLGAGARRVGKRLVLTLGAAGEVTYSSHRDEWVGKTERGQLAVSGPDARLVVDRLGLGELPLETATFTPIGDR
jgi:hypothetical protein